MALKEPQWINVQQKTFTKWYSPRTCTCQLLLTVLYRLNSKVASRQVAVNDLVKDLSDGVGVSPSLFRARD